MNLEKLIERLHSDTFVLGTQGVTSDIGRRLGDYLIFFRYPRFRGQSQWNDRTEFKPQEFLDLWQMFIQRIQDGTIPSETPEQKKFFEGIQCKLQGLDLSMATIQVGKVATIIGGVDFGQEVERLFRLELDRD